MHSDVDNRNMPNVVHSDTTFGTGSQIYSRSYRAMTSGTTGKDYQYNDSQEAQIVQRYKDNMDEVLLSQKRRAIPLYANLECQTKRALHYRNATTTYVDAVRTPMTSSAPNMKRQKPPDDRSVIAPGAYRGQLNGKHPKVFDGTSDERIFVQEIESRCRAVGITTPYGKVLKQLSCMKGPRVKDWVKKMYNEVKTKVNKDVNAHNDPALWEWFKQVFYLAKSNTVKKGEALKALLKLQMSKGNVEAYIERFEVLRKSTKRPEDSQGTL
jgi:hypothetical protein